MRENTQVRAMDDYFNALLLDDAPLLDSPVEPEPAPVIPLRRQSQAVAEAVVQPYREADERLEQLSELLAQVSKVQFDSDHQIHVEPAVEPAQIEADAALLPVEPAWPAAVPADPATLVMTETAVVLAPEAEVAPSRWENIDTGKAFQALFFDVAGVTFAVPLTSLGGIHQLGEVSSLFGQPDWYRGIMSSREQRMNVVDTARWVMPGQHLEMPDYNYLIMLGESPWGLACHHLKGTELLHSDQVKWRHQEGKRPWLAGMVKEKMCALLHVSELLLLLERGVNIEGRR